MTNKNPRADRATRLAEYREELRNLIEKIVALRVKVAGDVGEFGAADTAPNEAAVWDALYDAGDNIQHAFELVALMEA